MKKLLLLVTLCLAAPALAQTPETPEQKLLRLYQACMDPAHRDKTRSPQWLPGWEGCKDVTQAWDAARKAAEAQAAAQREAADKADVGAFKK